MLNGLRQQAIVKLGGVVEICSPELPAGAGQTFPKPGLSLTNNLQKTD